jgi:hypothetical protein
MLAPLTAVCLAAAAHAYQLPAEYLYAILAVEGGQVGQAVADRNGTRDLGPFQINTVWGPAVARFWGVSLTEALNRLQDDGCANAVVAAAILKQRTIEAPGDLSTALGLYHSHRAEAAERYRARALTAMALLAAGGR